MFLSYSKIYDCVKVKRKDYVIKMGKLIIDGNSVYEIDEECVKKRKPSKECGVYEKLLEAEREQTAKKSIETRIAK